MTDEQLNESAETDAGVPAPRPLYGIGPFTIREVVLMGIWLVAFVVSFFPLYARELGDVLGGGASLWTSGLDWVLTIGVPTVAVFLIVLRRLSPQGIRRVGSLGIDQFASVAFSVAAVVWLSAVWSTIATAIRADVWIQGWVMWVEFVLALAGVVFTVCAPFIPPFSADFRDRPEVAAHRSARPARAVAARPRVERAPAPIPAGPYAPPAQGVYPAPGAETGSYADTGAYPAQGGDTAAYQALGLVDTGAYAAPVADDTVVSAHSATGSQPDGEWSPPYARTGEADQGGYAQAAPAEASQPVAEPVPAAHQAFWALAPVERDVYDERGVPIFRIGPTAWALVLEDRGGVFVIRHEDGRIGYLHDVSDVTRG